jgi:hypothetical protein
MVTISILGLDQYIVGRLSRDLTSNIAKLYEISEEDVIFVAPNNMVFHKGVEQTSWNVIVKVNAPMKIQVLQDEMANLLSIGLKDVAINIVLEFTYYSQDNRYEKINKDYPRYLADDNLTDVDISFEEGVEDEDIFDGDIFENFQDK